MEMLTVSPDKPGMNDCDLRKEGEMSGKSTLTCKNNYLAEILIGVNHHTDLLSVTVLIGSLCKCDVFLSLFGNL